MGSYQDPTGYYQDPTGAIYSSMIRSFVCGHRLHGGHKEQQVINRNTGIHGQRSPKMADTKFRALLTCTLFGLLFTYCLTAHQQDYARNLWSAWTV